MLRPKLRGEGSAYHPSKLFYDCNSSKPRTTLIHGCIQCKVKGCKDLSCPICHPRRHQHNRFNIPFINGLQLNRSHIHHWQELETVIVCKLCGEVKKK